MQVLIGLLLVSGAFALLIWGAVAMRGASPTGWARKPFAAEMLAIFLIAVFAAGVGALIDYVTGLPKSSAYAWSAALLIGLPAAFVAVWRMLGISRHMSAPATPGGLPSPANDRNGPSRRRAA